MCHGHHFETGQMYCIYFWSFTGSLDSSRGNGPKLWHWSLLCKEVVWKHIAAWSKWKWIVWMFFGPPVLPVAVFFYIFSFLSTDVPWGQRPAWNAMASACGRLQQWDRVLNQFLGTAGCGGQSTARLTLKEFLSIYGSWESYCIRWFILLFLNGSFCCFCCVHFKIHFDQPQVQQHIELRGKRDHPLLRMNFFSNSSGCCLWPQPQSAESFFRFFFFEGLGCKTCCDIDQTYLGGGFKYNIFDFHPYSGK